MPLQQGPECQLAFDPSAWCILAAPVCCGPYRVPRELASYYAVQSAAGTTIHLHGNPSYLVEVGHPD